MTDYPILIEAVTQETYDACLADLAATEARALHHLDAKLAVESRAVKAEARIAELEAALRQIHSCLRDYPKTDWAVRFDHMCADALGIERCDP